MRYEYPDMPSEAKESHLEVLLAQSDNFVDAISLASLSSKGELIVVADKCHDILRDVAQDCPVILKGLYESVPIIGQSDEEKLEEACEAMGDWIIPQLELQLEMNLAVVYTALMHTKDQIGLLELRGKLIGKAHDKLVRDSPLGKMQFAQRFGTIRYLDASSFALGIHKPDKEDSVSWQYDAGTDFLVKAKDIAQGYSPHHQFLSVFNLGRMEFLRGKNRDSAREHLQHAHSISKNAGNELFPTLVQHYLDAIEDKTRFGTVIDDPPEYKASMMKLVTEIFKSEQKRSTSTIVP